MAIGILLACMASTAAADSNGGGTARYQTANVIDLLHGGYIGAATLVRERNEISGRIMTNVEQPGLPYTVRFIVINNPSACLDPLCFDPSDFGNLATKTSIFNASGAISAASGTTDTMGGVINVDIEVEAGVLPNDLFVLMGSRTGLKNGNGFNAMVWLVVDQHPPLTSSDSWISDLTTTHDVGAGPNVNAALALFVSCPDTSCPASVL